MTIDWDIINRVGHIQAEMKERLEDLKEGETVTGTKVLPMIKGEDADVTIHLAEVMSRMGMTRRLLAMAFPGYELEPYEEWSKHMHRHPQWAHPALFRLL
tara:strand:- start:8041 stop:8340 length:300 start_codon:yes stop_codon:yes gene_type:complete